jgi:hypothetical protein
MPREIDKCLEGLRKGLFASISDLGLLFYEFLGNTIGIVNSLSLVGLIKFMTVRTP